MTDDTRPSPAAMPLMMVDDEDKWIEDQVRNKVWIGPLGRLVDLVDAVYNFGRKGSIWPLQFGLACCAIEMISMSASRYDIARFGAELFRPSPRQADLMIVAGTVTKKMVPAIVRLYNQMAEPKYVISMGACATAGGPFKEGYNVVSGIDKFLPVDVYIPGCPPTPQALLNGIIALQKKLDAQSVLAVPWYRRGVHEEIAEPVLGPDIFDPRRAAEIKELAANKEKRDQMYVKIISRAELKHGKKDEAGEAKAEVKAEPKPEAKPIPKKEEENPRTINVALPAVPRSGARAPITAPRGETRPIEPSLPDKLMSERAGGLPIESPATFPGIEPLTPEREKKLEQQKADSDFAAQEKAHQEKLTQQK